MKTPTWEVSPGALLAFLNSSTALMMADLYTFTTAGGAVYRYTGGDRLQAVAANAFALGPKFERGDTRTVVGVEVATLAIDLYAEPAVLMGSAPMVQALGRGVMDGGRVQVERLFADAGWVLKGTLLLFQGRVATVTTYGGQATVEAESDTALLDVMIPSGVYQPSCRNTLYDARCGIARAGRALAKTAASGTDATRRSFSADFTGTLAAAAGYLELGTVTFTGGLNAGISRTVKSHTGTNVGTLQVANAWPYAVAAGDPFTCVPGCDKTVATCQGKFSNWQRFQGEPWIPLPETVT